MVLSIACAGIFAREREEISVLSYGPALCQRSGGLRFPCESRGGILLTWSGRSGKVHGDAYRDTGRIAELFGPARSRRDGSRIRATSAIVAAAACFLWVAW